MVVKQGSYYREHDSEQNDVQVDKFLIIHQLVRTDAILKVRCFYTIGVRQPLADMHLFS